MDMNQIIELTKEIKKKLKKYFTIKGCYYSKKDNSIIVKSTMETSLGHQNLINKLNEKYKNMKEEIERKFNYKVKLVGDWDEYGIEVTINL